ncbi:MAG: hypothetical protein ACRDL6_02605 [Solirubrobacterales bacterium]
MSDQVMIERRFRGPADSANGGYACGMLAAHLDAEEATEVTLKTPPPLDLPLRVERAEDQVRLLDGDTLVAAGRAAPPPDPELPAAVSPEEARRARESSPMQHHHPYPSCFVCGPERAAGDGLRVICGPVPGPEGDLVAAPFETDETMAGQDGDLRSELIWSVLDCPGGIAAMLVPDFGISVLGRLTASIRHPLKAGEDYVALGWPAWRDGRKFGAGSAIVDRGGRPLAVAEAVWIELRPPAPEDAG